MSYDNWKTTNPADDRLGRSRGTPESYRCRDCAWDGVGILAASEHYWQTEHTVLPATDPRVRGRKRQKDRASA